MGYLDNLTTPWPKRSLPRRLLPFISVAAAFCIALLAHRLQGPVSHVPPGLTSPLDSIAPDFTLSDAHQDAPDITLSKVTHSQPVLLVYYASYSCPRCVNDLREITAHQTEFLNLGVQIIAVSPDPPEFTRQSIAEYGDFPFPLLSDPDRKVASAYNLISGGQANGAVPQRGTFLIDTQGKMRFAIRSDEPFTDIPTLLNTIQATPGLHY